MRAISTMSRWRIAAAVALVAATTSCANEDLASQRSSSSGGSSGAGGSSAVTGAGGSVSSTCEASEVGSALLRRLTREELEASLEDIFDLPPLQTTLPADPASALGFTTDAKLLVVNAPLAREYQRTAESVADQVMQNLPTLLPCSQASPDAACAEQAIRSWGLKMFRRPATEAEVQSLVGLYTSVAADADFSSGIKWTIAALIQSPQFLYRSEVGVPAADGRNLDDYEIATELAYTYSGSTPDDALLALAAAGELSNEATRVAEAERLLGAESPRRFDVMRSFFREWLGYQTILGKTRYSVPNFADVISNELIKETQTFLDQLVFGENGTALDLMKANFTALDQTLSTYYGYGNVSGDTWVRVERPQGLAGGILAQGAVLAATSTQEASSPVRRGLLFTKKFLCMDLPSPPENIPPLESSTEGVDTSNMTTRQKYEELHAQGVCAGCHQVFQPFGYAFEHFDEAGRYRETENGLPIDATAVSLELPSGKMVNVDGLEELSALVDQSTDVQNCFSGLLTAYLLSGEGRCVAEEARRRIASGELSIQDYLVELAKATHFTKRRL